MTDLPAQTPFEEFIQSDLFTFYVGEEKRPFSVHSKAVASTSQYFYKLINGGMSEAQSRSAELKDIDPDTFVRFLEYAYRRDYTTPSWTQDNNPPPETASERPEVPIQTKKRSFAVVEKVSLRTKFDRREYLHPTQHASGVLRQASEPQPNTSPEQNFTPVFLAHAHLYTFASMYMIHPLKDLVLYKLHRTLISFQLYNERLGDVFELARYAYDHGEDRAEGGLDALRDMVVNFIAAEKKVLGKHADFRHLMDEGTEFAGDFWDVVSKELL